jgi:hypothetical protein
MATSASAISASGLRKSFGDKVVLDGIDLDVAQGTVFALLVLAVTWLAVALGLVTNSVETANSLPMPLALLPFLGSGFVPTKSMPAWLGPQKSDKNKEES